MDDFSLPIITNDPQEESTPVLYPQQRRTLKFVERYISENGYSPTLTEIRDYLGVSALSTVHEHLLKLEEKGFLERDDDDKSIRLKLTKGSFAGQLIKVPLVGMIAAGEPIDAFEEPEPIPVPVPAELVGNKKLFCLKVKGDSMIESLIADGDIVICESVQYAKDGDTVVALLDDNTATLKKFFREKSLIRLQPANPNYEPIMVKNITIQGRVVGVYRKLLG